MSYALIGFKALMAKLQEEERELRGRLRIIEGQRDQRDVNGNLRSEQESGGLENTEQDKESPSDDEFHDAQSEVGADNAEQKALPLSLEQDVQSGRQHAHLPDELIIQIISYICRSGRSQEALATCCLLSRQWYDAAIALLYRYPRLYGKNFDPFVRAICPSINLHVRKSPLAELVRVLDMSQLVHQGSKSVTARLLGRTKELLEEFVAPRASFSMHCFPALAKCQRLRALDLSLVCESPPLPDLFKAIANLDSLTTLRLPRSTGFGVQHKKSSFDSCWPTNITDLTLSGGIDAHFLHGVASFPSTLTHLTIEHCPLAKPHAITHLLRTAIQPLQHLQSIKIAHMPRLSGHALDDILFLLPQISRLSVSVDYITPAIFDEGHFHHSKAEPSMLEHLNLRTLELMGSSFHSGSSSSAVEKISPIDIIIALDEGTLPKLRQVRAAQSLGWHHSGTAADTEALTDALQEGARRDWEGREWVFAEMPEEAYRKARCWEAVSGVWVFEG